jgi:hypothetical protein
VPYKVLFNCFGLSLVMLRRVIDFFACWERVVALKVLLCGRWCILVFCGVFGDNEIIEVSKIARGRWWRSHFS